MLSIVICGTNDNSGYNLHKRCALTINAAAEAIGSEDEILFVDYNTSTDLPTLPEAIADTLTPAATQRMRIVRVRSIDLSEADALRAGFQAAAPTSQWLLPVRIGCVLAADGSTSLTAVLRDLAATPHRLDSAPVPKVLWGSLDRSDPQGAAVGLAQWAASAGLSPDVVRGAPAYLLPRAWVADPIRDTEPAAPPAGVRLYDCSFHGQAGADWGGLVDALAAAGPLTPAQFDVETFPVGEASADRYIRGLSAVVTGRLSGFLEAAYIPEAYGSLAYHPDHVLPYLLDLVSCVPPGTRIGYVGARTDMFRAFAEAWRIMGAEQPILVPDLAPWLDHPHAEARSINDWMDEAQFFIFEVGAETNQRQDTLNAEEKARLWAVDFSFKQTVERDRERQSAGAAPRRALVVNGIHNFFEPAVMSSLSVTLTPFSSRIRHGYFTDPAQGRLARAAQAERDAAAHLSRRTAFTAAELEHLARLASQLEHGSDPASWRAAGRMAAEIDALGRANWPLPFEGAGGWAQALERLAEARPSRNAPIRSGLVSPAGGGQAASRLARIEDWERPEWARLARLLFPERPHDHLFERDLWVWERVSLVENLERRFPIASGASVLLVGRLPEALITALAALDYEVDVVDQWSVSHERYQGVDWRADDSLTNRMFRKPIGAAADRPADFEWDAAIISQNGLYARGPDGVAPTLEAVARRVKVGGHVGACALVQLDPDEHRPLPTAFPSPLLLENRLTDAFESYVHLASADGADLRLTPHTLDRLSENDRVVGSVPGLVFNRPPILETLAVFGLTKTAQADPSEWRGLTQWLQAARVGRLND
jgi:hypothetical protein